MSVQTIDSQAFRETLGHYPTGVAVVTAIDDQEQPTGMVVGSFTSVSLDPPLVAFLPDRGSRTFARLRTAKTFCVNVLAADQEDICRRFAASGIDKFAETDWHPAAGGAPVLDGVVAWIECDFDDILAGGDHYIVMGRVRELRVERPTPPLLFFQGGYGKFSTRSLIAPADPGLMEAVREAEKLRTDIEQLTASVGADCSLIASVGEECVTVLTSHRSQQAAESLVGHRVPLVAPIGAVLLPSNNPRAVREWIDRAPGRTPELRAEAERKLATVQERGFSIALRSETFGDRTPITTEYSSGDRTPATERQMKQLLADTFSLYEPELVEDQTYQVASIVVPLPGTHNPGGLALRLAGLGELTGAEVLDQAARLQEFANGHDTRLR